MHNAEIALVGEGGQPLGSKPRGIITPLDTYHSVFVLFVTPGKKLLLRRLDSGKLNATGTAVCLAGETAGDAARRSVAWANVELHHLGDQMYTLPKQKTYASVYYAVAAAPENDTFVLCAAAEVDEQPLTPALAIIWAQYRRLLPVDQGA